MAIGPKHVPGNKYLKPIISTLEVRRIISNSAKHIQREIRIFELNLDLALIEDSECEDSQVFEVELNLNHLAPKQDDVLEVLRIITLLYKASGWAEVMVEFTLGRVYGEDLARIYFFKYQIDDSENMMEEGTSHGDEKPAF